MEIAAELNPLNRQRELRIAWNALMASYTFRRLRVAEQESALARARLTASEITCYTLSEVLKRRGTIVFLNFIAAALAGEGHWPALGNAYWYPISNPFVECYGADSALPEMQRELEQTHGVKFDVNLEELTRSVRLLNR